MAILAVLISSFRWGYSVDQAIYDAVISHSSDPLDNDILIVAIDERSLLELGRWPWSRNIHADLVNKLDQADVRAIAFDVVFAEPDRIEPENDFLFAQAMTSMGRVALLVHMEQTHAGGQILEVLPTSPLIDAAAALGHVHIEYDADGVCRAIFLKEGLGEAYWPHLMYSLWDMVEKQPAGALPGLSLPEADSASPFVIQRNFFNLIPLATAQSRVTSVSYTDVIHGRIPKRSLANKIIIVGATAKGLGDIVATPVGPMAGVEFNANIFNALRNQSTIVPVTELYHAVISAMAVLVLIMLGLRTTPRQYLLLTLSSVAVTLLVTVWVLISLRLWFAPLSVIIPVLAFYPLWSWRRLEQALRFLRVELARVEHQSTKSSPNSATEINQKLEFLSRLTGVEHWQVIDSKSPQLSNKSPESNQQSITWPSNSSPGGEGVINADGNVVSGVQWLWPEGISRHDQSLWLDSLRSLSGISSSVQKQVPSELVTGTISRLRAANKRADETRAFFDQCMENLQDAVIVSNLMGEIVFANARARATFTIASKSSDSLAHCLEQVHVDGGWHNVLNNILHKSREFYGEVQSKDASRQYFLQLAGLNWQSGQIDTLVFSFTDISMVKESERARNEALHFLSHDLRSPVVSILALIEHYRSNTGQKPGDDQLTQRFDTILQEIEAYARKNLSFAESFLQLARAEMVGDSNFDYCDMHSVIDNSLMMVRQLAIAKSINLSLERNLDDLWVWGDGELLERALINLLTNAIKYSDTNTEVSLKVESHGDQVVVHVSDQGIGINPADQVEIFKRFKRIDGKAGVSGAGLGLHFVDTVCRKHGGTITLTSNLDVGSCFSITLPLCNDHFKD